MAFLSEMLSARRFRAAFDWRTTAAVFVILSVILPADGISAANC